MIDSAIGRDHSTSLTVRRASRYCLRMSETELPAVAKSEIASQVRAADPRIEAHRQQYVDRLQDGKVVRTPKKDAREKTLHELALELNARMKASTDVRPILIIMEGPDSTGKSSTFRRLKPAFDGARAVDCHTFKAPPKDAEHVHWIKRFFDHLPKKGGVMFWDRSYYGRTVYEPHYGMIDDDTRKLSIDEINAFEKLLRDKIRIVKFYFDVSSESIAKTIGKREVIRPEKLGDSDYTSFRDRKIIKRYFGKAIARTGHHVRWHIIPMDNRAAGRKKMLEILRRELT
jgi:polyphosphate kinase 2 (PPK2 family)